VPVGARFSTTSTQLNVSDSGILQLPDALPRERGLSARFWSKPHVGVDCYLGCQNEDGLPADWATVVSGIQFEPGVSCQVAVTQKKCASPAHTCIQVWLQRAPAVGTHVAVPSAKTTPSLFLAPTSSPIVLNHWQVLFYTTPFFTTPFLRHCSSMHVYLLGFRSVLVDRFQTSFTLSTPARSTCQMPATMNFRRRYTMPGD